MTEDGAGNETGIAAEIGTGVGIDLDPWHCLYSPRSAFVAEEAECRRRLRYLIQDLDIVVWKRFFLLI